MHVDFKTYDKTFFLPGLARHANMRIHLCLPCSLTCSRVRAGTGLSAGMMHWSTLPGTAVFDEPIGGFRARTVYFAYLLACTIMTFAGAASYFNGTAAVNIVAAYWSPMTLIALFVAARSAWLQRGRAAAPQVSVPESELESATRRASSGSYKSSCSSCSWCGCCRSAKCRRVCAGVLALQDLLCANF